MVLTLKELILATGNAGKIQELKTLLAPIECIAQQALGIEEAAETGLSFVENAILKARHASRLGKKPALADDSGLVVEALHGAPGIFSARFAGTKATNKENIDLLLKRMQEIDNGPERRAYFYCALAIVEHAKDPTPLIATGRLDGLITTKPQGLHGFGYDPVFYLPDYHCTAAELPLTIKNTISHRAKAFRLLKKALL